MDSAVDEQGRRAEHLVRGQAAVDIPADPHSLGNVVGKDAALARMNPKGRIPICGMISEWQILEAAVNGAGSLDDEKIAALNLSRRLDFPTLRKQVSGAIATLDTSDGVLPGVTVTLTGPVLRPVVPTYATVCAMFTRTPGRMPLAKPRRCPSSSCSARWIASRH